MFFPEEFLTSKIPGCGHFFWREVLYLKRWRVHAIPSQFEINNLIHVCQKLELVRALFKSPIHITSGLRPGLYNAECGGSKGSYHKIGSAIDFIVGGFDTFGGCNHARAIIKPHLEEWDIRMEDLSVANWIHIDLGKPGPSGRFFIPIK